jgi:enoyl-CoA hydratase
MSSRLVSLQTSKILAEVKGSVGWLTINNPQRRNAVSLEMWQGLADAAAEFESDPTVRVVVIGGAGGKAFASGADISEFDQHRSGADQKRSYGEIASRGQIGLARLSKPLIAMIQGFCVGGGLAIALNADIRFATNDSKFAIPAARLGLGYEYAGLATLARLVGPSRAKDMLFSARFLDADEAMRWGLINFLSGEADLHATVEAYASRVAENAPLTVRAAKAAVRLFEKYSQSPDEAAVEALVNRCFDSEDYKEGRRAFASKRAPVFRGC